MIFYPVNHRININKDINIYQYNGSPYVRTPFFFFFSFFFKTKIEEDFMRFTHSFILFYYLIY